MSYTSCKTSSSVPSARWFSTHTTLPHTTRYRACEGLIGYRAFSTHQSRYHTADIAAYVSPHIKDPKPKKSSLYQLSAEGTTSAQAR